MPEIKFSDHLIFYYSLLRRSIEKLTTPLGGGGVEGVRQKPRRWLVKIIFLDNKVVLNFDFRHGVKKSGHCKVVATS